MHNSSIYPLWVRAKKENDALAVSIWFTAQDVNNLLSSTTGLDNAVKWCKQLGVTGVHLEVFFSGTYAKRETLLNAKDRFSKEGLTVRGGLNPHMGYGKDSAGSGWKSRCYTVKPTQEELSGMFKYGASMFDEIIIDDTFFTECQCSECITARGDQSWSKYRTDLMDRISQEDVMKPAHAVNPNVKIIIKYPQWYDEYHLRGYDVPGESKIFDGVWVGTEARNFVEGIVGYEIGYNAYFNMRWHETFGKTLGGGWFDSLGTTEDTFLEQARHTVLGGGNTIVLWHYAGMLPEQNKRDAIGTPVADMKALSKELPGLIELAKFVKNKPIKGIHLLKPGNSDPYEEEWVCSFLGELGLPLKPAHEIDEHAQSAVFPVQALKDVNLPSSLRRMLAKGTPVVITDGLAERLNSYPELLQNKNLTVLKVNGSPRELLKMTREELKPLRDKLLAPFGIKFDAPGKVELYLFGDNHFVVENINDNVVDVTLDLPHVSNAKTVLTLSREGGNAEISQSGNSLKISIPQRTLVAVEYT
jgi:hypothetical protein